MTSDSDRSPLELLQHFGVLLGVGFVCLGVLEGFFSLICDNYSSYYSFFDVI